MSDYSRFVSYMYLYENGLKTMNAGFVKVESRNGQCRIGLSLKNVYTGLERCQVYMFIRFGQDLRGVYIGDVRIKNHGSDWNFRTDTMNIAGSGYRLDQMSGMIIRGEGDKFYGTRWDHGDLDIHRFVTQWDDGEPVMAKTEPEPEMIMAEESITTAEPVMTEEPVTTEEMTVAAEPFIAAESAEETDEAEKIEKDDGRLVTMETDERRQNFGKILEQCPGMYPFEDDSVEACVRLEPQDIGRMPIDCWSYGSKKLLLP